MHPVLLIMFFFNKLVGVYFLVFGDMGADLAEEQK